MNDQATMAAQPFPPGMSRLERLPDELKLRVGYYLMAPVAVEMAIEHHVSSRTGRRDILLSDQLIPLLSRSICTYSNELKGLVIEHYYNDSVLALASTSTRLCNVFLVEHSEKYGLQNTLFRSIELGEVNLVRQAVQYGADINKKGTEIPWDVTPLKLAVKSEQLPIILYLLRCGVDKADELVMDVLCHSYYHRLVYGEIIDLTWDPTNLKNHCRCNLLHDLMDATLGSSQASRLPRETLEALVPDGRHLWFILRTWMRRKRGYSWADEWAHAWECDCGAEDDGDCPMRLISLLRRLGANWMPCGPLPEMPREDDSEFSLDVYGDAEWEWMHGQQLNHRGLTDLHRFSHSFYAVDEPISLKPSVAAAMHATLLASAAYRRDHCIPFLVAMLEHGVTAEQGDLSYAMDLASTPDTKQLSIAIVVALLRAGTDPNEPGAMKTAMRLACMEETKDAAVAFVTLLLEHGADPSEEEMRDEIQSAAEKWWVQSAWQSSGVFCRILRLLVEGGLDENVAWEILAVLGLDHDLLAEGGGGSTEGARRGSRLLLCGV